MLTFRAVAATLVALQVGLWIVSMGLRLFVAATGYDVLTTGDPRLLALAAAVVVPTAVGAGFAAVQAAHEATPRLVTGCAVMGAGVVWLWTLLEPYLGREPGWFQLALPAAVLAATTWGGRRALRRLAAGIE